MGDRRGLVGFEHALGVDLVGGAACCRSPLPTACARAEQRVRIGEGLGEVVDEGQLRVADADDVAGLERVVGMNAFAVDECAVAAIEIAEGPLALGLEDLGVVAAAALVLADDGVGRCATDRDRLAIDETENVGPFRTFANNEVGGHRIQEKSMEQRARSREHEAQYGSLLPAPSSLLVCPCADLPKVSLTTTYYRGGVGFKSDGSELACRSGVRAKKTGVSAVGQASA